MLFTADGSTEVMSSAFALQFRVYENTWIFYKAECFKAGGGPPQGGSIQALSEESPTVFEYAFISLHSLSAL